MARSVYDEVQGGDGKNSLSQHGTGTRHGDLICREKAQAVHPGCFDCDILRWDELCDTSRAGDPARSGGRR